MRVNQLKVVAGRHRAPDTDYVLDDQPGFLMRVALRRHTTLFIDRMIEDLTPPQFSVLAKLREVGPCSQNYLGRLIYFDAATIKGIVDRLSARGLLATCEDPSDRRRRAVTLTESGKRAADAAVRVAAKITEATVSPLSPSEARTLVRLLKKLI